MQSHRYAAKSVYGLIFDFIAFYIDSIYSKNIAHTSIIIFGASEAGDTHFPTR